MQETDVAAKIVLVRADLNVPLDGGRISDTTRLERFAPTARALRASGARVVVMTHLGRPGGVVTPTLSTAPVAAALGDVLGCDVTFIAQSIGDEACQGIARLKDGDIAVLENLRFHREETANDTAFARSLAAPGDVYVNDAFSCAHRAHASTTAIASFLPAFAGPSLMGEIEALGRVLDRPAHPVAALVGGAKVSTKIAVLKHLLAKMDVLIIGGGMANTFLAAQGCEIGNSLCENAYVETARSIMEAARDENCALILPVDVIAATTFAAGAPHEVFAARAVPADRMILDIGPQSVAAINTRLSSCRTLLWNGPLGAFELTPFDNATNAVAAHAAACTGAGALVTVAGGGDTVAALRGAGVMDMFSYVSTAGGAFLEWLEGRELPGITALRQA